MKLSRIDLIGLNADERQETQGLLACDFTGQAPVCDGRRGDDVQRSIGSCATDLAGCGSDLKGLKMCTSLIKGLREAAKGEACTLQLTGVCNQDWATTVYVQIPEHDPADGCFACRACRDVIAGVRYNRLHKYERDRYIRKAQTKTLTRLFAKGHLELRGFASTAEGA